MKTCLAYSLRLGFLIAACSPNLLAQEQPTSGEVPDESFAAEADALGSGATMFPIPRYEVDFLTREALLGDWGGVRTTSAEKCGMQFAVDVNQYYQGIWDSGRSRESDYDGSTDRRFMNLGHSFNPVTMRLVPYSTLGAGFLFLPTEGATFSFSAVVGGLRSRIPF